MEYTLYVNHAGQLSVEDEPRLKGTLHRKGANPYESLIDRLVDATDSWVLGDELEGLAAGIDKARRYVWTIRQQVVDAAFEVFKCSELDAVLRPHFPLP